MNRLRYYPAVDGLKGLFIFLIVLHNLLPCFPAAGGAERIVDSIPLTSFITIYGGSLGNSLFFMFSGFLISTGYRDRIRGRNISFPSFLGKRLSKLYPMYILTNFVMLILHILEYGPSGINLNRIISVALVQLGGGLPFHPYNGPSWFLSTLFLCYSLYFAITYFSSHATGYTVSLVACILVGYALTDAELTFPLFSQSNGMGLLNFAIGCIFAELLPLIRAKQPKWLGIASFLTVGVSFYLMMRYGIEIIAGNSKVVFSFLVAPVVLYLALESKCFRTLLETKPIQFLGKISLCLFFWHYPLYEIMSQVYPLLGVRLTELHLPLYLLLLTLFCTVYNYRTANSVTPP